MKQNVLFFKIQISIILALASINALGTFEEAFLGNKRPVRKIAIGKKALVNIPAKEFKHIEIVIAPKASKVIRFAAEELQSFLQERLQTSIPLTTVPSKDKVSFILGINCWSKQNGIDDKKLCRDAFIIKNSNNKIYILGRDDKTASPRRVLAKGGGKAQKYERGTLFGVYDFLERFTGVRFFFPGEFGTIIPQGKPLNIPQIDIYDRPDYECRFVSIWSGVGINEKNRANPFSYTVSPAKALAYHRYRLQTRYIPSCHGLSQLGLVQRFAKSHPEFFAMRTNGKRQLNPKLSFQPCFSSKVMEEVYKDAAAFLTGKPAQSRGVIMRNGKVGWSEASFLPGFFSIMPSDGFVKCQCANCQKHFKKGVQASSDFVWSQIISVANKLKKDKIPGKITMMAYDEAYRLPPNNAIPDNVLVQVIGSGWKNDPQKEQLVKDWSRKLGHKVWLWNYFNKFGKLQILGLPSVAPRTIGNYYKRQVPYIHGAFMESEVDKWLYNYLNYYVFSKVAWNNDIDINALLKDHNKVMFGNAAPVMEKIFNRLEELWIKKITNVSVDTPLGPITMPPSRCDIWTQIYSPKELAGLTKSFKQAEKLSRKDSDSLKRIKYIRREFLAPLVRKSIEYRRHNDSIKDFKLGMPTLKNNEKITIDGRLNEAAWKSAATIYLKPMRSTAKITQIVKTMVKIAIDKQNLYVAYDCEEPELSKVSVHQRQADDLSIWRDNGLEVFLAPSGSRKKYYQLAINSKGVLFDQVCYLSDKTFSSNYKWNSNALVKTSTSSHGWVAEISIPLKSLGFVNTAGFAANFCRNQVKKDTVNYTWSPFVRREYNELDNFGTLVVGQLPDRSIIKGGAFNVSHKRRNVFGKWSYSRKRGNFASLDESTFISEGKSLKLKVNPDVYTGKALLYGVTQHLPQLKPNTRYRISYFIKLDSVVPFDKNGGAVINVVDDKNRWFPSRPIVGTRPWFKQSFEFKSGAKTNVPPRPCSYIRLYLINASGTVWFDNIKLEEVK
jgi:hypothetical protein